jgi:glucosyl-3-phosphoglycerate synthase
MELSPSPAGSSPPPALRELRASVVVPAHDEELLIGGCLEALGRQQDLEKAHYEVIVVLDDCADQTATEVESFGARHPDLQLLVLAGPGQGAGPARASGMDLACARLEEVGRYEGLIATTDADSVVEADWLVRQLEAIEAGAQAIGGDVVLEQSSADRLPEEILERRQGELLKRTHLAASHGPADHAHFSGASLGVTPRTYRAVGGMASLSALEDQDLEDRLVQASIPIHRLSRVRVTTSARTEGRAQRGLAKDLALGEWVAERSYDGAGFSLNSVVKAKNRSIGLILPAKMAGTTIGPILETLAPLLARGLLDELLVIDADSADGTAELAEALGVRVVWESETARRFGPCQGKGDAMWRAAQLVDRDILVFIDADTRDFSADFVTRLLGPIFLEEGVRLVKGAFRRPFSSNGTVSEDEGGRVTELTARPLLNLHFPELAGFRQPLAGEIAIERSLFRKLEVPVGYGVEIAMLIDALRLCGLNSLAQVHLGSRQNNHQPLRELSAMALQVMVAAERRIGPAHHPSRVKLSVPGTDGTSEARYVRCEERPPW